MYVYERARMKRITPEELVHRRRDVGRYTNENPTDTVNIHENQDAHSTEAAKSDIEILICHNS